MREGGNTAPPDGAPASGSRDTTGGKNLLLLIQLRWLAVIGQVLTIGVVHWGLGIALPLPAMSMVLGGLVLLNLASQLRLLLRPPPGSPELFLTLAADVIALTVQLYLSGGATNPFLSLYLLQITLAAVLLEMRWTWALLALASLCGLSLALVHHPLALPPGMREDFLALYLRGALVCFLLDAVLLVIFVTRISGNLRERDANLARMRQQAFEEDHIVRMGLLASGAAHELGTPLATVSVILGDWRRMPALRAMPDLVQEMEEMQAAVQRCKSIVGGILRSAGEARGEAPALIRLRSFLAATVAEWQGSRPGTALAYADRIGEDVPIIADPVLKQVIANVLDNAHEASPAGIRMAARRRDGDLVLTVSDDGPGFLPEMLARLGRPYHSSKGREGRGLGLFLVVNVMRKLGGSVAAVNRPGGGATVTLTLPLAALALPVGAQHGG